MFEIIIKSTACGLFGIYCIAREIWEWFCKYTWKKAINEL